MNKFAAAAKAQGVEIAEKGTRTRTSVTFSPPKAMPKDGLYVQCKMLKGEKPDTPYTGRVDATVECTATHAASKPSKSNPKGGPVYVWATANGYECAAIAGTNLVVVLKV